MLVFSSWYICALVDYVDRLSGWVQACTNTWLEIESDNSRFIMWHGLRNLVRTWGKEKPADAVTNGVDCLSRLAVVSQVGAI